MFLMRSRHCFLPLLGSMVTAFLLAAVGTASAQPIYFEDFEDETLEPNTQVNANVTIANGIASFNDPTDARATFSVVQDYTAEVLTFAFDIVEPIVDLPPGTRMEMLFRAGVGTAHNTLSSSDQIIEAIMFRGVFGSGNRGAYTNNGNETIFMVANNKASDLTFTSPVDGATPVTLTGFQYIPYVRNNDTGVFGEIKGISNFNPNHQAVFGTFNRFGIGSSTNADVGSFAIDNVAVFDEVNFIGFEEPPGIPGDTNGNMIGGEFPDDFDPIRMNFRKTVSQRADGDLVRDGVVDFKDYVEWKQAFLAGGGSLEAVDLGFIASVPEPSTLGLLLWSACLVFNNSRRFHRLQRGARRSDF